MRDGVPTGRGAVGPQWNRYAVGIAGGVGSLLVALSVLLFLASGPPHDERAMGNTVMSMLFSLVGVGVGGLSGLVTLATWKNLSRGHRVFGLATLFAAAAWLVLGPVGRNL